MDFSSFPRCLLAAGQDAWPCTSTPAPARCSGVSELSVIELLVIALRHLACVVLSAPLHSSKFTWTGKGAPGKSQDYHPIYCRFQHNLRDHLLHCWQHEVRSQNGEVSVWLSESRCSPSPLSNHTGRDHNFHESFISQKQPDWEKCAQNSCNRLLSTPHQEPSSAQSEGRLLL